MYFLAVKKAKQNSSEGDRTELSERGEEQEGAKGVFQDEEGDGGEKDGDNEDEECDGLELPSGLTGEEERP